MFDALPAHIDGAIHVTKINVASAARAKFFVAYVAMPAAIVQAAHAADIEGEARRCIAQVAALDVFGAKFVKTGRTFCEWCILVSVAVAVPQKSTL